MQEEVIEGSFRLKISKIEKNSKFKKKFKMSILKNVETLCKKFVDDHPDSLRDAKKRCFGHLLKKKKRRSENDTSDRLLAIQIEMRTRGEEEKADELESLLGRIDNTAVLEMLLLLREKKRNEDRILASSENKKLKILSRTVRGDVFVPTSLTIIILLLTIIRK